MISACATPDILKRASGFSARVDLSADLASRSLELTGAEFPASLASASAKRKAEFVAGRYCAREALRASGARAEAPGIEGKLPVWPAGFVGSITHKGGFVSAAAARDRILRGIGIDSERQMQDGEAMKLRESIASAKERELVREIAEGEAVRGFAAAGPGFLYSLLFSAKESLYKALFPEVRVFFGFKDAEIASATPADAGFMSAPGVFRIRLLKNLSADFASGWECEGRFVLSDGWVHTAIEIAN